MSRTLDQIRRDGLEALRRRLGKAGMVQFLQQFDAGRGDYATERHEWVDRMSLDTLRQTAGKKRSAKRQSKAKGNRP